MEVIRKWVRKRVGKRANINIGPGSERVSNESLFAEVAMKCIFGVVFGSVAMVAIGALAVVPVAAQTKKVTGPVSPETNKKVFEFANKSQGKKLGVGRSDDLARLALAEAGAVSREDAPRPPKLNLKEDDYVWGKLLGPKDAVLPGDIMQFRDVEIVTRMGNVTLVQNMPNHTVIIGRVVGPFHYIVLHQNYAESKDTPVDKAEVVHLGEINMNFRTKGEAWIYRPISKDSKDAKESKDPKGK